MKKLLFEIFAVMLLCMGLVCAISGISELIIASTDYHNPKISYSITLFAGLCGLALFAVLLNFIIVRRLKRLSRCVGEVAGGNYDTRIVDRGFDEIHGLTQAFNTMTAELKSNEYLNLQFVRNVSHELKTPLSCIIGYAELLKTSPMTSDEIVRYADIIYSQSKHTLELSEQMLELAKLSSSNVIRKDDIFYLDEQIRDIILFMQNTWNSKQINMQIELDRFEICSNSALTHHIWQNLISNAIKFTPYGGTINITLTKGEGIVFSVSNTGAGIPIDAQPFIFNQFFTANNLGLSHGSGLGLPIAKTITERLGGTISFTSQVDELTTFTVKI